MKIRGIVFPHMNIGYCKFVKCILLILVDEIHRKEVNMCDGIGLFYKLE